MTSAAAAEKLANQDLDERLTTLIANLASSSDTRHDGHNTSIATLQIAVANLIEEKVAKPDMTVAIAEARGKLADTADLGSCTTERRGQLRYNTNNDLVEYCAADNTFKPVSYSPPGSDQFNPAASCQAVYDSAKESASGIYWIKEEGWTRASQHVCIMPVSDNDTPIDFGGNGKRAEDAAHSCRTTYDHFSQLASGLYYIRTVDGPVQTYCDMERNGGGE